MELNCFLHVVHGEIQQINQIMKNDIAEEDLWIETFYPFNKVTAVFLLDNYRFFIIPHTAMNPYHNQIM